MKHIFISHAGADSSIAIRLARDLKNAGHDTKIDREELTLGSNSIRFMNDGIAFAHTIIILYSKNTPEASWQNLEIEGAYWNEIEQNGGTCIVIRLDDTNLPPLLGSKLFGEIKDDKSYKQVLEKLCTEILPKKATSSIVSEALASESQNPFRRIRAEYFEDRPDLLAKTFASLDPVKSGKLEEIMPSFIEGSRGTGKSMLLLSLRARNFILRNKIINKGIKIFGFYYKLSRGAICNVGLSSYNNIEPSFLTEVGEQKAAQITDISSQELVICFLESIFSELSYCIKANIINCDVLLQKSISETLDSLLFLNNSKEVTSFEHLKSKLSDTRIVIAEFIRRKFIYDEAVNVPVVRYDLELLKRVIQVIKGNIIQLSETIFIGLFDEYENLYTYQQKILNGFIKLAAPDFSIKIAKKIGSNDTSGTTTGQDLQEIDDFSRIVLVYDVEDASHLKIYRELLRHITLNILVNEGIDSEINSFLPNSSIKEFDDGRIIEEIAKMSKIPVTDFLRLPDKDRKEKFHHYSEAATYRLLFAPGGRHKKKEFSGFDQLSFISSGVVRYFQEILGVAYHLTFGNKSQLQSNITIPQEIQTKAVHIVSESNLTTLSRNVQKYGDALKYMLLDLGDILHLKLIRHSSEPEAARISIENPELLNDSKMDYLRMLLEIGVREGVFQTKEGRPAFKPKHHADPQPTEFNISRIYAPVLQISPRLRWRTRISSEELLMLITPEKRSRASSELKKKLASYSGNSNQPKLL
jgi:hypothetical protein